MISLLPIVKGYSLTLGLIMAIGAQNAMLISQSIRNQHQWLMALICIVVDITLISLGVFGFGVVIEQAPELVVYFKWFGAAFLTWYGFQAFREAWKDQSLNASDTPVTGRRTIILTTLAVSLLNPHVYLDTVVLIGSVGAQMPLPDQISFALGASMASITWFVSLCLLGKVMQPLFEKPSSWKILYSIVGVMMWAIAASLLFSA